MAPRLILFDFDGTLADSFAWFLRAYDEVADALGLRRIVPEEVPALRHLPPRDLMRHFGVPAWRVPQVALRLRALQARDVATIRLFPGIAETLAALSARGITLAIVTSNDARNVRAILGPDLAALIAHYACGAPVLGKGPRLRKVLRLARMAPTEAIAIGDELRDLDAAREQGIPFGAVTWGYADPDALRGADPAFIFATPHDIVDTLFDGVPLTNKKSGPAGG